MRNFRETGLVELSPEEYKRQAEVLVPLQRRQMGELLSSGIAGKIFEDGYSLFGLRIPEPLSEGTEIKICRTSLHTLSPDARDGILAEVDNDILATSPFVRVFCLERTDVQHAWASFKIAKKCLYAVGLGYPFPQEEKTEYIGLGGSSVGIVEKVATYCQELVGARRNHGLTMLDPFTLEECWTVPHAPADWRPLDWN